MAKNIQTLKGFRDFLPQEAKKREWLRLRITEIFESWGFVPLETPTLEPLELFEGQIGEDEKLFFSFEDNGGRKVAMRYDQTVPTARLVGTYDQELPKPFKRYQIQTSFRAEKPQKGRYREFWQCDADIFGVESPLADAEVIALSLEIYKQLGFKNVVAKISDRSLMKGFPYGAIVAIDKLDKIGEKGVIEAMTNKGIDLNDARNYLRKCQNLKPNTTIQTIFGYLLKAGFDESWIKFEPTIARSFSYSSGPIWEIQIPEYEAGSVLGGERYNSLVEQVSGKTIPATGFAVGFDRTYEAMEALDLFPKDVFEETVLVTVFNENLYYKSLSVAKALRDAGINVNLYTDPGQKLAKQFRYADKNNYNWTVVVGTEEVKKNMVSLKNMGDVKQEMMSLDKAIDRLTSD